MNTKKLASLFVAFALSTGCASTTTVDSLPLTVMADIEPINNQMPIQYNFKACSEPLCNEAGLGGLRIGAKYAVTYSPNLSVNKLYNEYFDTKFFNVGSDGTNLFNVELLSVEESYDQMGSGSDFFKNPDDISVSYSFKYKLLLTYKDSNGKEVKFPSIAKKTITSTQSQIATDIKKGVSDAIGLTIVRFDKYISNNY